MIKLAIYLLRLAIVIAFFAMLIAMCSSCSSTWEETYTGPASEYISTNIQKVTVMKSSLYGGLKDYYYLIITNHSDLDSTVDIICSSFIKYDEFIDKRTIKRYLVPPNTQCSVYSR